jgi:hypothetical protein
MPWVSEDALSTLYARVQAVEGQNELWKMTKDLVRHAESWHSESKAVGEQTLV